MKQRKTSAVVINTTFINYDGEMRYVLDVQSQHKDSRQQTLQLVLSKVDSEATADKRHQNLVDFSRSLKKGHKCFEPNKILLNVDGQLWYGGIGFPDYRYYKGK